MRVVRWEGEREEARPLPLACGSLAGFCGSEVWLNEATVWTILPEAVGEIIV